MRGETCEGAGSLKSFRGCEFLWGFWSMHYTKYDAGSKTESGFFQKRICRCWMKRRLPKISAVFPQSSPHFSLCSFTLKGQSPPLPLWFCFNMFQDAKTRTTLYQWIRETKIKDHFIPLQTTIGQSLALDEAKHFRNMLVKLPLATSMPPSH